MKNSTVITKAVFQGVEFDTSTSKGKGSAQI